MSNNVGGGIDMTKLQQLKAYQPPKLDYLVQMKIDGQARANLISADAMNLSHNPRARLNDRGEAKEDRQSSINRNDQTRESLQSRLIERIHSKKISNNNF